MKDLLLGPAKYLLREVTDTGSELLEVRPNDRVVAKKGAIYAILGADDLDPVDVLLGTRRGDTLIITLPDGTLIELKGYFPDKGSVDGPTFADFSSETLLKITDEEEPEDEGGTNWMLWGLGGAAVLGGAALASGQNSGGGDGSDISVSIGQDDQPTATSFNITGISSRSVIENREYVSETPKTQNEDGTVTWTLEGEDAELFIVDAKTGVVSMQAQNYEAPLDGSSNNSYRYVLVATDAAGNETRETITVVITDEIETSALSIQGLESTQVLENVDYDWSTPLVSGAVGRITWGLSGDDADRFDQDPVTGALTFRGANYEAPSDLNADNVYRLRVTARDEDDNYAYKDITVAVNDVVEASQIRLLGVNDSVVLESATFFSGTPTVTGAVGAITWRLDGDDAALFSLDSETGAISLAAQNFEAPDDANGDNVYSVILTAIDEDGNQNQRPLKVTVLDRDESTSSGGGTSTVIVGGDTGTSDLIKGLGDVMVIEHKDSTLPEPSVDGIAGPFVWTIYGTDAEFFTVNSTTGAITFKGAEFADYENPADRNRDNVYQLSVRATSLTGGEVVTKDIELTVVNDAFEIITDESGVIRAFPEEIVVFENSAMTLPLPKVPDVEGEITWALSGDDAAKFTIDAETGLVALAGSLDYEMPTDANGDNNYKVQLVALQEGQIVARHNLQVNVRDVVEGGDSEDGATSTLFTVNGLINVMVEEHKDFQSLEPWIVGTNNPLAWSLYGEDADFFTIDEATGVVSFAAQDYENPLDLGRDNVYRYGVRVEDPITGEVVTKSLVLYVVDDPSEYGSSAIVAKNTATAFDEVTEVAENTLFRFSEPDALSAVGNVTWSIRGEDATKFSVDPDTGVVTLTGKNFEAPTDANADNLYSIELVARDADMNVAWIPLSVRVTDVIEVSQVTITGVQNDSVRENFDYESAQPVAIGAIGSVQWSIDGDDASYFSVDQYTGVLTMQAKDYELPGDLSGNNVYRVTLTATDADGNTASKNLAVAIDNVNETGDTVNTGNTGDTGSGNTDTTPPTLVSISSAAGSADYFYNETVYITAAFSKPVKFLAGSIAPVLELSNGGEAVYYSGNGTYQITFKYTVQADDKWDELNVDRVRLGSLMGANNVDFLDTNIELITSNLLDNAIINLDATPRIIEINSTLADGTYGEGATIPIQVVLDQAVTVQTNGSIQAVLALNNGRQATYVSGSGTNTLLFEYNVGPGEDMADLNVLAFAENEQLFVNAGGLDLSDSLSSLTNGNLVDNTDISIGQPEVPSIVSISATNPDGVYILGDSIILDVVFDAPVYLESNGSSFDALSASQQDAIRPYLALNSGGTAQYVSGSGTNTLRFEYVTQEDEVASNLDVSSLAENGTSFVDAQGNVVETAIIAGTLSTGRSLVVDADSPEIVSMTNTEATRAEDATGWRVNGEIAITFSSEISVVGTDSKLILSNLDDPDNQSYPAIGQFVRLEADGKTLVYSYDGYLFDELIPIEATALLENGTVILDLAGNAAKVKITSGDNDIAGTLLAGAGEFVSALLGLRVLAADGTELVNTAFDPAVGYSDFAAVLAQQATGPVLFEIYDINGVEADYRDEYTGLMKSLGGAASTDRSLRVVIDAATLAERDATTPLTVTPLSELAVRLGNAIAGGSDISYPLDDNYLVANQLVGDLFGVTDITTGPITFADLASFQAADGLSQAETFGLALAMLSTLDAETGGLFDTLELLLASWSEEAQYNQLGLPSPGSLKDFLHQALALIDNSGNAAISAETRIALSEYVSALTPYQAPIDEVTDDSAAQASASTTEETVDETTVFEETDTLDNVTADETLAEAATVAATNTDNDISSQMTFGGPSPVLSSSATTTTTTSSPAATDVSNPSTPSASQTASEATTQSNAEANAIVTVEDSTPLLFKSSLALSRELTGLMSSLSGETDASSEASLMQELAVYTAASRVRAALLAPEGSTATTSVQDYEQLGFVGVADHNRALVDTLVTQALLEGNDSVDIAAQVAESLAQFDSLRAWALQSGESERVGVTVGEDPAAQLDKIADKLDVLFADSDYDDVLVDFLTQSLLGDDDRYVFASVEVEEGSALLSAVELPVAQLGELLSAGSIVIEGRDAEGRWQQLSEVVAMEGDSGVITLESAYQGFSGFRVSAAGSVSAEVRAALAGATVWFETQTLEATAFATPLEGVEHLTALSPTLAAQLLSWSDADDWSDYHALNQVLPTFSALQEGYVAFYEGTPDATALRAMLRLSLSLAAGEDAASSALQASAGSFAWSDVEALTGIELSSDADVDALLSELSSAYASDEGVAAVVSELHRKAWLAESEGLLDASFNELATRVFALSNDDMDDAGVLQEVARLGSVIKFKQLLEGSEVELSVEDVAHFGLGELAEGQLAGFTRYLATQAAAVRADETDLHDVLGAFVTEQADAQIALEALLAGPSWVEREVAINADDSLSRLLSLLSAEYGDNSAVYSGLVTAILGAVASTERTLATIAFEDGPVDYVELLDASGERLSALAGISVRCYRNADDAEGELLSLTPVADEIGRFALPAMAAGCSHIELVTTGYPEAVQQMASVRVLGQDHGLTAGHLAALGYDGFDADDIPRLYQLASVALTHNSDLAVDTLLEVYQQLKPLYDWQDGLQGTGLGAWQGLGTDLGTEQLAALWQWAETEQSLTLDPYWGTGTFSIPSPFGGMDWQNTASLWQELADGSDEVELVTKDENSVIWGDDPASSALNRAQVNAENIEQLIAGLPYSLGDHLGLGDLAGVDFSWLEQQDGSGELQ